jgi:hypothetical protein
MAHESARRESVAAVPSAVMAWVVMMAAGLALGALAERRLGHLHSGNGGEYLTAFLVAMPVPFALAIVVVYIPIVLGVRAVSSGTASPLAFGTACIVAAPLAGLTLLAMGSAVWGPPAMAGGYMHYFPPLLALALGGLVFGLAFGWFDRRS